MKSTPRHPDYPYGEIAYHDSWISVDPIIGCQLDCRYCFLQVPGWARQRPVHLTPVPNAVRRLLANPHFRPDETAIAFGNQTDAFLPVNVQYTEDFVLRLDAEGLQNPLILVSKMRIPTGAIKKLCRLRNIRLVFFLSYSGLGAAIEPSSRLDYVQENLHRLRDVGAHIVHYWRPIVAANTTREAIDRTLALFAPIASSSVYIGLKVNPRLREVYSRHPDLKIPRRVGPLVGDYLPRASERLLRSTAAAAYPDFPLYKHASCAVSLVLGMADYNGTWQRPRVCQASACPATQRQICRHSSHTPASNVVRAAMARIQVDMPFSVGASAVTLDGVIDQEQLTFLTHYLRFPVRARQVNFTRLLRGSIFTGCEVGNARTTTHDRRPDETNEAASRTVPGTRSPPLGS